MHKFREAHRHMGRLAVAAIESMETRVMFAAASVTPPPPPQPITLVKGLLSINANPKTTNTITVVLSTDKKTIDVTINGKTADFKVSDVNDVTVHDAAVNDKVSVNLSGLAPKTPPKNVTPPPPEGATVKNGLLTIAGSQTTSNNIAVTLSKDGKSVDVTIDGKSSVFSAAAITDINVFEGQKSDIVSVKLPGLKLAHPVLVEGSFGENEVTGGGFNYDLHLPAPPPAATA